MSPNLSLFVFKTGNESVTLFVLEPIGPERHKLFLLMTVVAMGWGEPLGCITFYEILG